MGRDVTGLRMDRKPGMINVKPNGTNGAVLVSPKSAPEKAEAKDQESDDCPKQDVLGIKSTNHEPEEKIIQAETQRSTDKNSSSPIKPASVSADNGSNDANSSEPVTPVVGAENNVSGAKFSQDNDDAHTPKTSNKSLPRSPSMSAKQHHSQYKKFYDDEDSWSMASSNATSVRTNKSRITVPVAPKFTVDVRLERRKEYYTMLDEKHKALQKEKQEYEARIKEEEAAAIKQLRKNMVVKANPVPSFYREGPPPKPELKKLPVTRPKSPNLTRTSTRRKSCGDAVRSSTEDKAVNGRASRHSVGAFRDGKYSPVTPKLKDRTGARKSNETSKVKTRPKEPKEATEIPKAKELADANIAAAAAES